MNPYYQMAQYKEKQNQLATNQENEIRLFLKGAKLLQESIENNDKKKIFHALRFNERLWSAVKESVDTDKSSLPLELRQKLFNLSGFIDKRIRNYYEKYESAQLEAIIKINKDLARGLLEKSKNNAAHTTQKEVSLTTTI